MNGSFPPAAASLARILLARARARVAVRGAGEDFEARLRSAFHEEIGVGVERASPLLVALLADEGLTLDELAWMIDPAPGWPYVELSTSPLEPRTGVILADRARKTRAAGRAGVDLGVRRGGRLRVQIVVDSIEVEGWVGTVHASTGGGLAKLTVRGGVPDGVAGAAIGRLAAEVVDLPLLAGRDWRVVAVERSMSRSRSTFVVEVGSRPYRMPWAARS